MQKIVLERTLKAITEAVDKAERQHREAAELTDQFEKGLPTTAINLAVKRGERIAVEEKTRFDEHRVAILTLSEILERHRRILEAIQDALTNPRGKRNGG